VRAIAATSGRRRPLAFVPQAGAASISAQAFSPTWETMTDTAKPAWSETAFALAVGMLRADLDGGAAAVGEAMMAAEVQHGHVEALCAFDLYDRLKRCGGRGRALARA
jgi:hypothetical protein